MQLASPVNSSWLVAETATTSQITARANVTSTRLKNIFAFETLSIDHPAQGEAPRREAIPVLSDLSMQAAEDLGQPLLFHRHLQLLRMERHELTVNQIKSGTAPNVGQF